MSEAAPQPDPLRPRWYRPTLSWLVAASLVATALLWLSNWLRSPSWHKGYDVLTAVAGICVVLLLLLWWIAALVFRLRFQFSLRSLLMLTVAVALPFSWLGLEVRRAATQRLVANEFHQMGCTVLYDHYFRDQKPVSGLTETVLVWLRGLLGDNFFSSVNSIFVSGGYPTDADFDKLKDLPNLWQLDLGGSTATDTTLEHVGGLVQLGILSIKNTQVTDFGLNYLRGLTRLHELSLGGTKVTDAGVKQLQQALPNCYIER